MRIFAAGLLIAVGTGVSIAQPVYNFQMRLIPDGAAGAPSGPWQVFNIGDPSGVMTTRIGFWLQARVAVTGDTENWGIVRASSSPGGDASFIQLNASVDASLSRGTTNVANTDFGRGRGYRSGDEATGNTGNAGDSQPFPRTVENENGGLDNGGSGGLIRRVYGFNSWVGATRQAADPDDPSNPWGVNGGNAGAPVPSDGTFSPWASLYRIWVDIPTFAPLPPGQYPEFVISASAYLSGSLRASPADPSAITWDMQEGPGQLLTTTYAVHVVPAPSALSASLAISAFAARRRR